MTIQDWAAVAEVMSGIAIIITLIYLTSQIKLARNASADETRHHRVAGIREMGGWIISNDRLRKAWHQASTEESREWIQSLANSMGISYDEAIMVGWKGLSWAWTHWAQFRGISSPADRRELENIVSIFYADEPMNTLIKDQRFRAFQDTEFIAWVDKLLDRKR